MSPAPTSTQLAVWLRINRLKQNFELDEVEHAILDILRQRQDFT